MSSNAKTDQLNACPAVTFVYPGICCNGYNSFSNEAPLEDTESWPIYGLALLAGCIKQAGGEMELLDLRQLESEQVLIDRLMASTSQIVAITVQTPSFNIACRVAELAKGFGKTTVAGGIHASVAPDDFDLPCWDHVISGDGEISLPWLVTGLVRGEDFPKFIQGEAVEDLDSLPMPHFFTEWLHKYRQCYSIEAARGCFGRCSYCVSGQTEFYPQLLFRTNAHILYELEFAYRHFEFASLNFLDVNATADRKRFNALLEQILERFPKIQVSIQDRPDTFNEETARLLSQFEGGALIWFGFESGSPRMLEFVNKDLSIDKARAAVELCHKYGLRTAAMTILGIPTETDEDRRLTFEFIKHSDPELVFVNVCSPFPGTPLYDYCQEHQLLPKPLTAERFHIRKIFERGLLKGVDYQRVLQWHNRIHALKKLAPEVREKIDKLVKESLGKNLRVGIFGAGGHTEWLLQATELAELQPVALFDNNLPRWGDPFMGIEILPPRMINELNLDLLIISSQSHEQAMYQQLSGMGCEPQKIVRLYQQEPERAPALPETRLIAARGLWDRLAPANSFAAVKRGYIKGIPNLVRPGSISELSHLLQQLEQELPAATFHSHPLLVMTQEAISDLPELEAPIPEAGLLLVEQKPARVKPIYRLSSAGEQTLVGDYLPLETLLKIQRGEEKAISSSEFNTGQLFCESLSLLQSLEEIGRYGDLSDALLFGLLPSLEQFRSISTISDLAEGDLMARQPQGG